MHRNAIEIQEWVDQESKMSHSSRSLLEDDFKTDVDLQIAYFILEQQVKLINGNEQKLIVPANWVRTVTENAKPDPVPTSTVLVPARGRSIFLSFSTDFHSVFVEDPPATTVALVETKSNTGTIIITSLLFTVPLISDAPDSTTCLICLSTERQIACLPCGHLASCVVCGHSLKTCPLCRAAVKGYIRIYL